MYLIKIYDKTCYHCEVMAQWDEGIAIENDLSFYKLELDRVMDDAPHIAAYVHPIYVEPYDGQITVPIYILESEDGDIQASGQCITDNELRSMIAGFREWQKSL